MRCSPQLRRARRVPAPTQRNGWFEILPVAAPANVAKGIHRYDFVVLGAGICGLSAGRRLAELRPDDAIAVVEAGRVGHGTSGRNAGFMLSHHSHGGIRDIASGRRNDTLFSYGHEWLAELVERHQIRCDWTNWGQVYVAADAPGEHHLDEVENGFNALGVTSKRLERDAIEALTSTRFYSKGLRVDGASLVQPAAMMRGLGETLPGNVTLYEDSPVMRLHNADGEIRLICADAEIVGRQLILANHVFAEEFGFVRHRIACVALFASLTDVLTEAQRALFTSEQIGLLPASPNGSTVRLTLDGRILMCNTIGYAGDKQLDPSLATKATAQHRDSIRRRWPELDGVTLCSTWGGFLGFTRNEGGVFGEIFKGVHVALSADASPMTKGAAAGKLLAESICGIESKELSLMRAMPRAAWLPPDPLLGFVARRRIRRIERQEHGER